MPDADAGNFLLSVFERFAKVPLHHLRERRHVGKVDGRGIDGLARSLQLVTQLAREAVPVCGTVNRQRSVDRHTGQEYKNDDLHGYIVTRTCFIRCRYASWFYVVTVSRSSRCSDNHRAVISTDCAFRAA